MFEHCECRSVIGPMLHSTLSRSYKATGSNIVNVVVLLAQCYLVHLVGPIERLVRTL